MSRWRNHRIEPREDEIEHDQHCCLADGIDRSSLTSSSRHRRSISPRNSFPDEHHSQLIRQTSECVACNDCDLISDRLFIGIPLSEDASRRTG